MYFSQISSCMPSYKDAASNIYPYSMKRSRCKVQFYDQHNADEASSCGLIIKSVITVLQKATQVWHIASQ